MKAGKIHRQMLDVVVDRDFDALRDLYHRDYVYTDSEGVEHKGAEAGVAVAELYTTAFPDLRLSVRHHWEPAEDVSIIEFGAHGTHGGPLEDIQATGKVVDMVVCNIIEVVDGKIRREREYFDTFGLLKQLGVAEG